MNSSKTIFLFAIIALIMLFVYPIQSIPTNDQSENLPIRHKRWTFNTWRLHGRRQLSNGLILIISFSKKNSLLFCFLDFYFPKTSNGNYENGINDITNKIDERLSEMFQE